MCATRKSSSHRGLLVASSLLAACYCMFFGLVGWTSPTAVKILRDFDASLTWRTPFLSLFHLGWTIPVGVVIALLLLRKDRHFTHETSKRLNVASVLILSAFILVWLYAALSRMFPRLQASPISG